MDDRLSAEELAERAGTDPGTVEELSRLGIIGTHDGTHDGGYGRADVMLVRVVAALEGKGIDPEAMATALRTGDLTLGYLQSAGRRPPRADQTLADLAGDVGRPVETLERLYLSLGLTPPAPDEHVRAEDLEGLRALAVLLDAGVTDGEVMRLARVWSDAVRRIAQFQTHYLHETVEQKFRRRGLRDNEAFEATIREVGLKVGRSGEVLLSWLFRRHAESFFVEHQFEHVETALHDAGARPRAPRRDEAVVFADLSGYTRLTEEAGDESAVRVSVALADVVAEAARRHNGTVVKMLGDGVLFHFDDPGDAVRASLDVVDVVEPRGLPPAHVGVNAGPMIYDIGDYFGHVVNVASRIASVAGPGEILVGERVAATAGDDAVRFEDAGAATVKGVAEPVRVFRALRAGADRGEADGRVAVRAEPSERP